MLYLKAPQPSTVRVTRGSKVQNFTTYLQEKCLGLYTPHQQIAVDKSTVGYKGMIFFKTYNPQNPTKWGLRVFVLEECKTGYICSFQPYFGKQTIKNLPWPDQPFTSRIVLHLVDQVTARAQGTGYYLYTDRHQYALSRKIAGTSDTLNWDSIEKPKIFAKSLQKAENEEWREQSLSASRKYDDSLLKG